ncbi:MAG: hypothetical protein KME08_18775 [Aphanothece sp. CMT-3BRIN-NPC111]|jgi:hypothetical protein|nr:hypothetical protein [Aphanothece sp. CMT-3BRIN-NPC111]
MKNILCTVLVATVAALGFIEKAQAELETILFNDNFDIENNSTGQLDYNYFTNFTVSNGTVDLKGNGFSDYYPGNGLYVDLEGTTGQGGLLLSRKTFSLIPGKYKLYFVLAGNPQSNMPDTVNIRLGNVYNQILSVPYNYNVKFQTLQQTINVSSTTTGKLSFQNPNGGDTYGPIVDKVKLTKVITGYDGAWKGAVTRNDNGQRYPVLVSIVGGESNSVVGTTVYPTKNCGGKLTLLNGDTATVNLRENISYGNANCTSGQITLQYVNAGAINYKWVTLGVTATGTLNKVVN